MIKPRELFFLLSIVFLLGALEAQAAEPQQPTGQEDSEGLVKQAQNPVADLISVPFRNNYNFAAGPKHNHMCYLLNIQPVIPVHITENWNLISRIIQPVINLTSLAPEEIIRASGLAHLLCLRCLLLAGLFQVQMDSVQHHLGRSFPPKFRRDGDEVTG